MKNSTYPTRRQFMRVSTLVSLGLISTKIKRLPAQKNKQPNIIFLMADDHKAGIMGCAGYKDIQTPNMDKLAERGLRFNNCYATSPLCMASRATVMTGMYEYKTGCNFTTGKLSSEDWTNLAYPVLLKKAGYRTAFAGKWGFLLDVPNYQESFNKWGGFRGAGQGSYSTLKNKSLITYAEKYLDKLPIQPKLGRQYYQRNEWDDEHFQDHMKQYCRLISGIDSAIGMILDELKEQGIADNTVIIYTSDNGYFCGAHGLQGKVLPYDDSALIPLIIYDPRYHSGEKNLITESIAGNIDFAPTILDLAGLKSPEKMDGESIMPLVKGEISSIHDSLLIVQNWGVADNDHNKGLAVATDKWKYIVWCYADKNVPPAEELFDLKNDPLETKNVINKPEYKKVLEKMRKMYDKHCMRWAQNCVEIENYTRYKEIFNRNTPWQNKRYRTFEEGSGKKMNPPVKEKVKEVYKELTGANPDK